VSPEFVHYLPIVTTVISAAFFAVLLNAHRTRRTGPHLLWWAAGALFYGLGTGLESIITLFGNSVGLTKAWYIAGALLGGYPLAQGVAYLLLNRRLAHFLTAVTVPIIAVLAILVILSPANLAALEAHRPGGAVLGWTWVRYFTPLINLYAAAFLVGGAIISAVRYRRTGTHPERVRGNSLIAVGGILPGIGGSMAKGGVVEALYIGELVGIVLIWAGYTTIVNAVHLRHGDVSRETQPETHTVPQESPV
jgi:hypothetical protein